MPIKNTVENEKNLKWNFYVNKIDKMNYLLALTKCGKTRCQSAGIRALMHLYINDPEVQKKVNDIVDDFIVYKQEGTTSCL